MDLAEARSILGQLRDAVPSGQWGANLTTAVQRALVEGLAVSSRSMPRLGLAMPDWATIADTG